MITVTEKLIIPRDFTIFDSHFSLTNPLAFKEIFLTDTQMDSNVILWYFFFCDTVTKEPPLYLKRKSKITKIVSQNLI